MVSDNLHEMSTKQKILTCAVDLFAEKGYTETTVRELAEAAGLRGGSIYNHFPSKSAILEYILEDYSLINTDIFADRDIWGILRENPNSDGVLTCLQLYFPPGRQEYYIKVLCVLLQEQLRNPIVRAYMGNEYILRAESNTNVIVNALKELKVIRGDADPDYWMKIVSSLFYTFASRMMLGIGDSEPGFAGRGMIDMLRQTFDYLIEINKFT